MPDLSPLAALGVLPLWIAARAIEPIELPRYSGSTLRGAFGAALKRLVCVRPDLPQCDPCPLIDRCAYPYLFETQAGGQPGTVGFTDLPRPYVIHAPAGEQRIPPG